MIQDVIEKTELVLLEAAERFDCEELLNTTIKFDLRGRAAGQAVKRAGQLTVRYNKEAIDISAEDMLSNTIPHEVAHLVCFMKPELGRNHNKGWERVCRALGGNGERCHDMPLKRTRRVQEFEYDYGGTETIWLGAIRHNKMQRGQAAYRVGGGGTIDKECWTGRKRFTK